MMVDIHGQLSDPNCSLIFAVRNSLEGRYCQPFMFGGRAAFALGLRAFDAAMLQLPVDGPVRKSDLTLWIIGSYDPAIGKIYGYDKPVDVTTLEVSNG